MRAVANQMVVMTLAVVIVATSLICGLCFLLVKRAEGVLWQLCIGVLGFGPLVCLFLVGMLVVAFFRTGRRHFLPLALGASVGLVTFAFWFYSLSL